MSTPLIDHTFDDTHVSNPDGSVPMEFHGATIVAGPGDAFGGSYPKALSLNATGAAAVDVSSLALDQRRFHVRIVFRLEASFEGRQNLVESDRLPFALFLHGAGRGGVRLVASVNPTAHGWRAADTRFGPRVTVRQWHCADLVYDLDTVAVYLDEQIVSVRAFPQGRIDLGRGTQLFVGTWVDGRRDHLDGKVAALQLHAGIPAALESQLDERRSSAEWYITHKAEQLRPGLNLGEPTAAPSFNARTGAWIQTHEHGDFMHHPSIGAAFEMHGAIRARYRAMTTRDELGYLVTDEVHATDRAGRKSLFSRGGIYWSAATGAHAVLGQLYLDYESKGESRAWGFPTAEARRIPGGSELVLQRARMYHRDGQPAAHEVHGAILERYLATGGPSAWGFPVTDETPLRRRSGSSSTEIGRSSEFENCTFHWSPATGAREVHGDIRRKYLELGGPTGQLGLPTTDEGPIPGVSGPARANGFQHGSLCWYGSYASIVIARPFKLFLATLNTKESEGFGMGQNDIYLRATIKRGGATVYSQKHPSSGDWGGRNVRDVNITFPAVLHPDPAQPITLELDVWESDSGAPFGGGDDHLGTWTKRLDAANGWGLLENGGILDSGAFSKINNIRVSVKPEVDVRSLTETQKWWGVTNAGTDDLTWAQYAQTFRDVDSETEWWDAGDGLAAIFYELVAKDIAEGGNCFGMSTEAIYARKGTSAFSLPLDRFTTWNTVRPTVNSKQAYQVGAAPIWWFVGQFLSGSTHDPVGVFQRTHEAFRRGDHPVLCISQNYDFSGAPHCVLPIGWDTSVTPWRLDILDPNFPGQIRPIHVDPRRKTFTYEGGSTPGNRTYTGGQWSGGRMHYMPFCVLNTAPRTPVWEAIMLILTGAVILVGADAETVSITDAGGSDLDAYGTRARRHLQGGGKLDGFFVNYRGLDGTGVLPGEMLLSAGPPPSGVKPGRGTIDPGVVVNVPVRDLIATRDLRRVNDAIGRIGDAAAVRGRTIPRIAADPRIVGRMDPSVVEVIDAVLQAPRPGDFVHEVRGKRRGTLRYAVRHQLSDVRLQTGTATGQKTRVSAKDLGTRRAHVAVRTDTDHRLDVTLTSKLGVAGDRAEVRIAQLPALRNREVLVEAKPGLGAIDILAGGAPVDVPVTVTTVTAGRSTVRDFDVRVEGGARLTLSAAQQDNLIEVSRIERADGPVSDTRTIVGR